MRLSNWNMRRIVSLMDLEEASHTELLGVPPEMNGH